MKNLKDAQEFVELYAPHNPAQRKEFVAAFKQLLNTWTKKGMAEAYWAAAGAHQVVSAKIQAMAEAAIVEDGGIPPV